jgi:hypothetical protein
VKAPQKFTPKPPSVASTIQATTRRAVAGSVLGEDAMRFLGTERTDSVAYVHLETPNELYNRIRHDPHFKLPHLKDPTVQATTSMVPALSIREKATQLLESLERTPPDDDNGPVSDSQNQEHYTLHSLSLAFGGVREENLKDTVKRSNELLEEQKNLTKVLSTLAGDMNVECRERGALLAKVCSILKDTSEEFADLVSYCDTVCTEAREQRDAANRAKLEVEKAKEELRRSSHDFAITEADLRSEVNMVNHQLRNLQVELERERGRALGLEEELEEKNELVAELEEAAENDHNRETIDRACSPMMPLMLFATELAGAEDSPAASGKRASASTIEDNERRGSSSKRRSSFTSAAPEGSGDEDVRLEKDRRSIQDSPSASAVPTPRVVVEGRKTSVPIKRSSKDDGKGSMGSLSASNSRESLGGAAAASPGKRGKNTRSRTSMENDGMRKVAEYNLSQSPVTTSFPALVPFLTFRDLDADWEDSNRESLAAAKSHLESHLGVCQANFADEQSKTARTQAAVEIFLQRLLAWVRRLHSKLDALDSTLVGPGIEALDVICRTLRWLATRASYQWAEGSSLEPVLDSAEKEIYRALDTTVIDPNLETRQVITTLKNRIQELESSAEIAVKEQQEKQGAVGQLADKKKEHVAIQCDIIQQHSVGRSETEELAKRSEMQTARRKQQAETESASQKAPVAAEAPWKVGSAVDAYLEKVSTTELLTSPLVQEIDFTCVPTHPRKRMVGPLGYEVPKDKLLPAKQMMPMIEEVYDFVFDRNFRDLKSGKSVTPIYVSLQEVMRRTFGVRSVIMGKTWLLVESWRALQDKATELFVDFVIERRASDELHFFLYLRAVLREARMKDTMPRPKAEELFNNIFGDMPDSLAGVQIELAKAPGEDFVAVIDVLLVGLEGWRLLNLLGGPTKAYALRVFMLCDKNSRLALDAAELYDAGCMVGIPRADGLVRATFDEALYDATQEYTSLPDFLSAVSEAPALEPVPTEPAVGSSEHYIQACSAMFDTLSGPVSHYMATLLHSDEPKDMLFYQKLKALLYTFQAARDANQADAAVQSLRVLVQLLYAHAVDFDNDHRKSSPQDIESDLKVLYNLLERAWTRARGG